uniref:non-specific serine/threonine protein kinase n=1 Tax=Oryza brachyantha TaxID=4533 RepID=J3LU99_ORYBR
MAPDVLVAMLRRRQRQWLVELIGILLLLARGGAAADEFVFPGFSSDVVNTTGVAVVTSSGLLQLTNETKEVFGHGFYQAPVRLRNASTGAAVSFSTSFVFAILPKYPDAHGHGLAFALAPSVVVPGAVAGRYLGLFNTANSTGQIAAVEFDTAQDEELGDIDDNHVGVDVNSPKSKNSTAAGYHDAAAASEFTSLSLISSEPLQVWIEYDGDSERLEVTLSPAGVPRPATPLVSCTVNLSSHVTNDTYVGFSAANGAAASSHYVLGWSFRLGGGRAQELDLSKLPRIPSPSNSEKKTPPLILLTLLLLSVVVLLLAAAVLAAIVARRRRFAEEEEEWEIEYGPHRISYKDLHGATKGFRDVIGAGGFGRVVVHRDIKASNVLLDADMNGKLSDFGLARLYDHGTNPQTTRVVGTLGYLAPELSKTGKATTSTDVFAFGAFLLEVACGRRPMDFRDDDDSPGLVELVLEHWKAGKITAARDPRIGECNEDDLELVLKLGLLCSHPDPQRRPSMRQVVQILEGAAPAPETLPEDLECSGSLFYSNSFDEFVTEFPSTSDITTATTHPPSSQSTDEQQWLVGSVELSNVKMSASKHLQQH